MFLQNVFTDSNSIRYLRNLLKCKQVFYYISLPIPLEKVMAMEHEMYYAVRKRRGMCK